MRIRNILNLSGWLGTPQIIVPNITFTSELPSLVRVVFSGAVGYDVYDWSYSNNEDFSSPTNGTSNVLEVADFGAGTFYVRVTARNTTTGETTPTISDSTTTETTPLRSLTISANAGNGEVTITHNCTSDEPNVDYVSVRRRLTGVGSFVEIDTFTPTTTLFVDTSVTNGVSYEYILTLIPATIDFTSSNSNTDEATPQASTPKLSTPTGLNVAWDDVTGGTGIFTWNSVFAATSYDVYLDDVFVANVTAATRTFTGLTVGQSYKFSVIAKATGYDNSNTAFINRTAIDPDEEFMTFEEFAPVGVLPKSLPLDGRYSLGLHRPLINYEPLTEVAFETLTGLDADAYPNGFTKITAVKNDLSGDVLLDVFDEALGMEFCGLKNNFNPTRLLDHPDRYAPLTIGSRYSKIIWVSSDGSHAVVDFLYNGGNPTTPQVQLNGRGYAYVKYTAYIQAALNAIKTSPLNTIRPREHTRDGWYDVAYVAPELATTDYAGLTKDILIEPISGEAEIKYGIEDYYYLEINFGAVRLYNQAVSPNGLFRFNGYTSEFVVNNVKIIPPHGTIIAAEPTYQPTLASGTIGGGGLFMVRNGKNASQKEQLEAGAGCPEWAKFVIGIGNISNSGTFTGNGSIETHDVQAFGCESYIRGQFTGAYAFGQKGGGARGAQVVHAKDCDIDFEDQESFAPPTQALTVRFTTDKTGINPTGDDRDPSTKPWLPSHCLEITTERGNWIAGRAMGGTNRVNVLEIDGLIFHGNNPRLNQIEGYYGRIYNGDDTIFEGMPAVFNTPKTTGGNTISAKKMLVDWEIPRVGNIYTIQRDYCPSLTDGELKSLSVITKIPAIGMPIRNQIRTHINWAIVLQKYVLDFTEDDRLWIRAINRRPQDFQVDDQFKLCAWVEVASTTGLAVDDAVTIKDSEGDTIATGTIYYIDDYYYSNRIVIKGCTANIQEAATINDVVVTYSSTFDPTVVYTTKRKQVVQYVSSTLTTSTDSDGNTWTYAGVGDYSRGVPYFSNRSHVDNTTNLDCYYPASLHVWPDLPDNINGDDFNKPHFEVEIVTSRAERLLDGNSYPCNQTYRSVMKFATGNIGAVNTLTRRRNARVASLPFQVDGYGYEQWPTNGGAYADGLDGRPLITNLMPTTHGSQAWTTEGEAQGHCLYNTGELSYYLEGNDMHNSFARVNNTSPPNTYIGAVLAKFSKFWVLVNNINMFTGQWRSAESGSTRNQWMTQALIYAKNPLHERPYEAQFDEKPALYLYGTDSTGVYYGHTDGVWFELNTVTGIAFGSSGTILRGNNTNKQCRAFMVNGLFIGCVSLSDVTVKAADFATDTTLIAPNGDNFNIVQIGDVDGIVRDANAENALARPKIIQDKLIELGEITP